MVMDMVRLVIGVRKIGILIRVLAMGQIGGCYVMGLLGINWRLG